MKPIKVNDNQGNTFKSYNEAAKFWKISPNTVKNDCLGKIRYSDRQKGSGYERKIRFERG